MIDFFWNFVSSKASSVHLDCKITASDGVLLTNKLFLSCFANQFIFPRQGMVNIEYFKKIIIHVLWHCPLLKVYSDAKIWSS